MIRPHEVERVVFKHSNNAPGRPDILTDQAADAEALVVEILGNPVSLHVMDGMDRLAQLREAADNLLAAMLFSYAA